MDSAEVTEIKRHIDAATEGFRTDVSDVKRHFGVVAESLRSEIRQVAEAVSAVDSRLSALQTEVDTRVRGNARDDSPLLHGARPPHPHS